MSKLVVEMGQRLRQLRKEQNITQEQIAEYLEISAKHVGDVERGKSSYSLEKLAHAATVLNCSMDFLFFGKESANLSAMFPATIIELISSGNEREIRLLQEYLAMYDHLLQSLCTLSAKYAGR